MVLLWRPSKTPDGSRMALTRLRAARAAFLVPFSLGVALAAQDAPEPDPPKTESALTASTFAGLKMRGIGPAITSGRVSDNRRRPHR